MPEDKLYTQINSTLLEESKRLATVDLYDGEGQLHQEELNLPSEVELNNPYSFDLSKYLPNINALTLERFFGVAKQLIEDACTRNGKPVISVVEEYPPDDMADYGDELISFRCISREPAKLDATASSRVQRNFRPYYQTRDVEVGDNVMTVWARPMDHEVEFTCWATSNKLANRRAIWLENLFTAHSWAFKSQGADRFFFRGRLADGLHKTDSAQRIMYRPLRFFLRFNDYISRAESSLKNIEISLKLANY